LRVTALLSGLFLLLLGGSFTLDAILAFAEGTSEYSVIALTLWLVGLSLLGIGPISLRASIDVGGPCEKEGDVPTN